MRQRSPDHDLNAKATDAFIEAEKLPPGPQRIDALSKATRLRNAADTYSYLFSNERTSSG